jgi:hypothetical protein
MPKFLLSNTERMQELIEPSLLPEVFKDLITLCKELAIDHLWIDALCIV